MLSGWEGGGEEGRCVMYGGGSIVSYSIVLLAEGKYSRVGWNATENENE